MTARPWARRRSGILLHPSSLPGGGDLGRSAYYFVDFLHATGQTVWQVLPLGPTHVDLSPYNSLSVHAGNVDLVSLSLLQDWNWLDRSLSPDESDPEVRDALLARVHDWFRDSAGAEDRLDYLDFLREQSGWLPDYVLFKALREHYARPWVEWPKALRDREPDAVATERRRRARRLEELGFEQYLFFRQWRELARYAHGKGVLLFGDMPIFVAHDSADVWARRHYFRLDARGRPTVVAGVPPDAFSDTGQLWGNPLYDWPVMRADGYAFWRARLAHLADYFDLVRIDHFRGFEAFWELPATAATAAEGRWVEAPGAELFERLGDLVERLPVVAEDLGHITPEVHALRERFGFPGMRVLQFAFCDESDGPYLPHHHVPEAVVYTGTHDNDTSLAWYESLPERSRKRLREYAGGGAEPMPWPMIRLALASVCRLCILPMQDVLGLGAEARMNKPGTVAGNWRWRFDWPEVTPAIAERLRRLTALYGRA